MLQEVPVRLSIGAGQLGIFFISIVHSHYLCNLELLLVLDM